MTQGGKQDWGQEWGIQGTHRKKRTDFSECQLPPLHWWHISGKSKCSHCLNKNSLGVIIQYSQHPGRFNLAYVFSHLFLFSAYISGPAQVRTLGRGGSLLSSYGARVSTSSHQAELDVFTLWAIPPAWPNQEPKNSTYITWYFSSVDKAVREHPEKEEDTWEG